MGAIMMTILLLLSTLPSLAPGAPLSAAGSLVAPSSGGFNVTAVSKYFTSTLLQRLRFALPTFRRCGGRRKCRGGNSPPPPPPPPPPPTRISQSLLLQRVNASMYAGLYKEVVEAGWGISIGIYDEKQPGWRSGVSASSIASTSCDANLCGSNVQFSATIPWNLQGNWHHRATALSASQFCGGMASAKKAMTGSKQLQGSIRVPDEADVTVLTTDVHHAEAEVDWAEIIIAGAFATLLCVVLCGIICAAAGAKR